MKSRLRLTSRHFVILTLCVIALAAFAGSWLKVASSSSGSNAPRKSPLNPGAVAELRVAYSGSAALVRALQSGSATPGALASADLDRDGAPDVVAGYAHNGMGIVTVQRGNSDAFAPKDDSVFQRMHDGYNPDALLPSAETFITPEPVDFLQVGDFNQDSAKDVLIARRGGGLYLLAGDGRGELGAPEQIALPGTVTALTAGEFNAPDGRTDVAVGISGPAGSSLLIFQDPSEQLQGSPLVYQLKSEATSIQFGALDDDAFQDVAIGAGREINIIHGFGRKLVRSLESRVESIPVPYQVRDLAFGNFVWERQARTQIAALGEDGSIHILGRGKLDARPFTQDEIAARSRARGSIAKQTYVDIESAPSWEVGWAEGWSVTRDVTTSAAGSVTASQVQLLRAHISFGEVDDLLLVGDNQNKINIVSQVEHKGDVQSQSVSGSDDMTASSMDLSDAPVAVVALPQKLNGERTLVLMQKQSASLAMIPLAPTATITVDRTDDPSGAGLTAASACTSVGVSDCSLRGAVQFANANPGTTITLGTNTYTLSINGAGGCTIENSATGNTVGDLEINVTTTITGTGAASTIISQTGTGDAMHPGDRAICIDVPLTGGKTFSFSGLTIAGARDSSINGGAGILGGAKDTTLNLTNVTFANNQFTGSNAGGGGALVTGGDMNVTNCTFGAANNPGASRTDLTLANASSNTSGGGLGYTSGDPLGTNGALGTLTIIGTTFTHNTTGGVGGGGLDVFGRNISTPTVNVSTSVFSNNQGTGIASGGGIINESANLNIATTSLTANSANNRGGGLYVGGGTTLLDGTTNGVTFTSNTANSGGSSVSTAGTVNLQGTHTTLDGSIEVTFGGIWNNSTSTLTPTDILVAGGIFNCNGGTMNMTGDLTIGPSGNGLKGGTFNGNTGTVNIAGDFSLGNQGTDTPTTLNAGTSTFNFNGSAAQSISNNSSITFNNLTDSNTTQPLTFNNSLAINGSFNVNGANAIVAPVAATILSGSGTLTGTGTARATRTDATPDFLSQYTITSKTLTNLTIDYAGAGDQTVNNTPAYSNLRISGTGTKTLQAATSATGNLTIAAAVLDVTASSFFLNIGGNWTNSVGASGFTPRTGTVTFNGGSGTQTVSGATTFYDLTLNNSGATTSFGSSATTISHNLTTSAGTMDGSTSTITFTGNPGAIVGANAKNFNNLVINSGAVISNSTGGNSTIANDYTNNGTFTQAAGLTTTFKTGADGLHSLLGSGTTTFGNFMINSSNTVDAGAHNFNVVGATVTVDGTFTGNTSTVTFNGAVAQAIAGTGSKNFSGLTINSSNAVTLNDVASAIDATVSGLLTLTSNLTIASGAILQQTGTSAGAADAIGTVRRTDLGATARAFGSPNVSIAINSGTAPTQMDVTLAKIAPSDFPPPAPITRTYTLAPTGGSGISATLKLHYLNAELNGNTETKLGMWKKLGANNWAVQGRTGAVDTANKAVTLSGVTSFSDWTLADVQAPTITCPGNQSANASPGVCTAVVNFPAPTATGIPTPTVTCVPASGSTFNKGVTTVSCTATNNVSPDATCTFTVTVNDTQPPMITCPANITQSTDPNQCAAVVTFTPTASDNCTLPPNAVVCAPASGAAFPKGVTDVTCTVTDGAAMMANCSFTVTVNDTQLPTITCPSPVVHATDPNACAAVVTYAAPAVTDNCPGVGTPSCLPASGATFAKGVTTVSCTVMDASSNSNSCSFTVTVNDTQVPVVTCPPSGGAFAASDCLPSQSSAYTGATLYSAGPNVVTNAVLGGFTPCTAPSASGMATISFTGILTGDLAMGGPPVHFQAPVTGQMKVTFNNLTGATRTFDTEMLQLDISGGSLPTGVLLRESPTQTSTGQTKITTVTGGFHIDSFFDVFTELSTTGGANWTPDGAGSPRHIAAVQSTDAGQCSAVVNYPAATATDNCSGVSAVTCVPASGTTFSKGTTTVTCSATDAVSNPGNCSFTVTVVDTQLPTLTCPANINLIGNTCQNVSYTTPTPSDNCPSPTVACVPASGTCFAVGATTVTCTATDSNANTSSCSFTVTVTPCTITCPSNVVVNAAAGVCTAVATYAAPTTTGSCGTVTCSPVSGSTFQKGVTTVTCNTVAGPSCSFTVTVNDTQPPVITCPAPVTHATDPNVCTAVVTFVDPTVTDNCPPCNSGGSKPGGNIQVGCQVVCSPASGSTFQKGVTTVTCTATDASNNTAMCSFTVTVNDTQPPAITCPAPVVKSTDPNVCTAIVTYSNATASDNCPGVGTPVCSPASGTTFQKGVTTVSCSVSDASNNSANCSFTVTVNDTQPPTVTCPGPITKSTDPNVCTAVVTFTDPTVTDNCPPCNSGGGTTPPKGPQGVVGCSVICSPASGSTFQKGVTTVSCTATDASNNTANCSFTVTVNDTQAPSITCPSPITKSTDPNACTAVVTFTPTATDNCPLGPTPIICSPASGATFQKGVTTVSCTATDTSTNTANCSFTVTVNDTQAPSITCPSNISQPAPTGQCSAVVTYSNATATDNCAGVGTPSCLPASGSTFQKGVTTVTCSVTDASSNPASCTFSVTITDTQPPTITCPANVTHGTDPNVCNAVVTYANATATDNCSGVGTPICTPASGSTFPKGVSTVSCSVSDASSNTANCTFTVTVNDTQNPSVTCPANITFTTPGFNDACGTVNYATPSGSDNCAVQSVVCAPASGMCFPVGMTTVTCTVTDTSNNTGQCTFKITVQNPCTITCPANITKNNDANQCGAVVTFAPMTTGGGCGTVACSPSSGSFFPKGTTTVTCTTAGPSCSFTVTVNDAQPPNINCPANITQGTDSNQCQAVVTYPAPAVSDNCPGVGAPMCTPASGGVFPKGSTTITCTVKDSSNNMSMCSFLVTVADTQPPVFPNGCPTGITKAAQATCPFTNTLIVTYTTPIATDNCGPAPTVTCTPPSGSIFPAGTTTVTCTATDSSGNTATCSFPINVFSFCLKDDSTDFNAVFVNALTGDYLFCQNGVPLASGRGTLTVHGCNFQVDHIKGDRKVHIQGDTSGAGGLGAGTAYIQKTGGGFVVQITDRKMTDDVCTCAPGLPPPAPSK